MSGACYKTNGQLAEENELLRAQLIQCTTAMREGAKDLRAWVGVPGSGNMAYITYTGATKLAERLEAARAEAVTLPAYGFEAYQAETRRTANGDPLNKLVFALGLCGEAGEVAELIKKFVGHGVPFELDKLKKELGDVLWYLARLADEHGIGLQDVADANIVKLRMRYPDGFKQGGGNRKGKAA